MSDPRFVMFLLRFVGRRRGLFFSLVRTQVSTCHSVSSRRQVGPCHAVSALVNGAPTNLAQKTKFSLIMFLSPGVVSVPMANE